MSKNINMKIIRRKEVIWGGTKVEGNQKEFLSSPISNQLGSVGLEAALS